MSDPELALESELETLPLRQLVGPKLRPHQAFFLFSRSDQPQRIQKLAREFGDIVPLHVAGRDIWVVSHPDLVREIWVTQARSFQKSFAFQVMKKLIGEGLLTSEAEFHLRQRRLVQPLFLTNHLRHYASSMVGRSLAMSNRWNDGQKLDIAAEMARLTMAIAGETLFSADVERDAKNVAQALRESLELFNAMLTPAGPFLDKFPPFQNRFLRAKGTIDELIYRFIRERRASGEEKQDLLSLLLESRSDDGAAMSEGQVRDEALTLFVAGFETTSHALSWTWHLLAQHPEIEAKWQAELREVLGGRAPTYDDLQHLTYTRQIFAETLRLYPPAWIVSRRNTEDVTLPFDGARFIIPSGTNVAASAYVLHRDPRFWPEPERFNPDRFAPGAEGNRPKYAYFPFGAGTRQCIGEGFAWMEGTLVLATLGQNWRLKSANGKPVKMLPRITLRPRNGIWMTLQKRAP